MKRWTITWKDRPFKLWRQLPETGFLSVGSSTRSSSFAWEKEHESASLPSNASPLAAKCFANLAVKRQRCSSSKSCFNLSSFTQILTRYLVIVCHPASPSSPLKHTQDERIDRAARWFFKHQNSTCVPNSESSPISFGWKIAFLNSTLRLWFLNFWINQSINQTNSTDKQKLSGGFPLTCLHF